MKKKLLAFIAAAAMMAVSVTGCGAADETAPAGSSADTSASDSAENSSEESASPSDEVSDGLTFIVTLYSDYAPITCENFEKLVSEGFYDGLTFHRVIDNFMAQGGDPLGTGIGGSDENIKGEFAANGVDNKLSHKRGVISMARSQEYDSASSQFFICYTDDCTFLDGNYAAFGEVTEGMEVIDSFLEVKRTGSEGGTPETPIKISTAKMISDDADGNHRAQFTMEEFLG